MRKLAIIGSNDLAKLIAYYATECDWEIAGFFDNKKDIGTPIEGYGSILGNESEILNSYGSGLFNNIIVGVGYTQFRYRKKVFETFKGKIPFANIIHSSSYVDRSVKIGEGIFILPGSVVDMNCCIDDNVLLNTGTKIAHDSRIMSHSFVAPGVTIAGNVIIGESNFIGVGSTIIDGVKTCAEAVVGGGALIIKDITEAGIYFGVPAKRIKDSQFFN